MAKNAMVDVAIVGGGPGGLALANAIERNNPDVSYKVFERAPEVPKAGAGVVIHPNGYAALDAIDPSLISALSSRSIQKAARIQISGPDDNVFNTMERDWKTLENSLMVPWSEMTDGLYQELPRGVVQFGHQLGGIALPPAGADGVTLQFQDGQEERARLVVGCDGLMSPVRRHWLPDDAPASFNDKVVIQGRLPSSDLRAMECFEGADGRMYNIGGGISAFIYGASEDVTVWVMSFSYAKAQELGVDYVPAAERAGGGQQDRSSQMQGEIGGGSAYEQALKVLDAMPPSFQQVVRASDPGSARMAGEYIRRPSTIPDDRMGDGPVTLLGDAMHPASVVGQGANMAFEDAAVLSYHLAREGPTEAALRAYEADRLPRVKSLIGYICHLMDEHKMASNPQEAAAARAKYPEYKADVHDFHHPCMGGGEEELA